MSDDRIQFIFNNDELEICCGIYFPNLGKTHGLMLDYLTQNELKGIQALLACLAGDIVTYDKYYCNQCNERILWNWDTLNGSCKCGKRYHVLSVKSLYRKENNPEKNNKIKVCLGSGTYNTNKEIIKPLEPIVEFCKQHGVEIDYV